MNELEIYKKALKLLISRKLDYFKDNCNGFPCHCPGGEDEHAVFKETENILQEAKILLIAEKGK